MNAFFIFLLLMVAPVLPADGGGEEIAHNLYSVLIEADKKKSRRLHLIFSQKPEGQNRAVFDRLNKAAVRSNI